MIIINSFIYIWLTIDDYNVYNLCVPPLEYSLHIDFLNKQKWDNFISLILFYICLSDFKFIWISLAFFHSYSKSLFNYGIVLFHGPLVGFSIMHYGSCNKIQPKSLPHAHWSDNYYKKGVTPKCLVFIESCSRLFGTGKSF